MQEPGTPGAVQSQCRSQDPSQPHFCTSIPTRTCRPVQYEQKPMTQTQKNGQEKGFLHILTRVNTRNKAENIYISHFRWTSS